MLEGFSLELPWRFVFHLSVQFLGGRDAAEPHVEALMVVSPAPFHRHVPHLLDVHKKIPAEPFVPLRWIAPLSGQD